MVQKKGIMFFWGVSMLERRKSKLNFYASKKMHSQISDNDLQIEEIHPFPFPIPKSSSNALTDLIALKRLRDSYKNNNKKIPLLRASTN